MSVNACQTTAPTTARALSRYSCACRPSKAALVVQIRNAASSSPAAAADPAHGANARRILLVTPPSMLGLPALDRKSTRLNSSHEWISYAVFCWKKKKNKKLHNSAKNKLNYNSYNNGNYIHSALIAHLLSCILSELTKILPSFFIFFFF